MKYETNVFKEWGIRKREATAAFETATLAYQLCLDESAHTSLVISDQNFQ